MLHAAHQGLQPHPHDIPGEQMVDLGDHEPGDQGRDEEARTQRDVTGNPQQDCHKREHQADISGPNPSIHNLRSTITVLDRRGSQRYDALGPRLSVESVMPRR